jgi:hypothetical protein
MESGIDADEFFSLFSFSILFGNSDTALKEESSIAISERMAMKYFDVRSFGKRFCDHRYIKQSCPLGALHQVSDHTEFVMVKTITKELTVHYF